MGEAKYERSSRCAMAITLRTGRFSFDPFDSGRAVAQGRRCRSLGRQFLGGDLEEDFFEAHAHRPQFQQSPSAGDDLARELAPYVASPLAFDFERARSGLHV